MCLAVKGLASSLCLQERNLMAMMTVYFDDSGTHTQSDIAIAACSVSDVMRWEFFESEWNAVLDETGIREPGFHMAEFVARQSPFDRWNDEKRDRVLKALIGVINRRHVLAGMVTAVVKKDYDTLVVGKLREKLGHYHYTFAVQSCLALVEEWRLRSFVREKAPTKPPKRARARKGADERSNKKAEVIAMMKRAKGATLAEITEATGWQKHTVRGFVSILGSKGGEKVESSKNASGERTLRPLTPTKYAWS